MSIFKAIKAIIRSTKPSSSTISTEPSSSKPPTPGSSSSKSISKSIIDENFEDSTDLINLNLNTDSSSSKFSSSHSSARSLPSISPVSPKSVSDEWVAIEKDALKLLGILLEVSKSLKSTNDINSCVCDNCKKKDFQEYRFKCLVCDDYDLCGICFEKRKVNKDHQLSHPVVRFDVPGEISGLKFESSEISLSNFQEIFKNETHEGITCDICSINPIKGLRLKCDTCNDFDLCYDCYSNSNLEKQLTSNHSLKDHPCIVHLKSISLDENNIEFMEKLGSGAFGTVYKSKLKNLDKLVACKVITIKKEQDFLMLLLGMNPLTHFNSYIQELNAYKELKGVNILKMFGYCIQKKDDAVNLMIITEFMSKGSLKNLLENEPDISYRRKFDITCDIAAGMARIHEHQFIHRDIRPDNILIDSKYTAKIGDMGIAKLIETNKNTQIGCKAFMPPEFYLGTYDQKLDVCTFGLTMNIIFNGEHQEQHPIKIIKDAQIFREQINSLVKLNPEERPTSKIVSVKLRLIKKFFDEIFFSPKVFSSYVKMTTLQKNFVFEETYKILREVAADEIDFS